MGDNPNFHLEDGVPVFERLNTLDRKAAESEIRDKNFKEEQLRIDRRVMHFTGVLACPMSGSTVATLVAGTSLD